MTISTNDLMETITRESERFIDAITQAPADAAVPTCPDWTADDLLCHLTEVHAFWAGILATGAQTDEQMEAVEQAKPPRPDRREDTIALFREQTAKLVDELTGRADDEAAWFWLETDQTVGATRRMQAHEATMHRIDAELTAGVNPAAVAPGLAADGVEHAVDVMWAWWGTLPGFELRDRQTVALTATDTGQTWHVDVGRWIGVGQSGKAYDEPGAVLVDGGDARAEVTGSAAELYRWLWGRGDEPSSSGDAQALAGLRAVRDGGMN